MGSSVASQELMLGGGEEPMLEGAFCRSCDAQSSLQCVCSKNKTKGDPTKEKHPLEGYLQNALDTNNPDAKVGLMALTILLEYRQPSLAKL